VKAFRDSAIRTRRRLVRPPGARGEPAQHEWLTDASARLCAECGWFAPPAIPRGDPMRRLQIAGVDPIECPHCRERLWIDLAHVPSATMVRQDEIDAIRARNDTGSLRWIVGTGTLLASSVALLPWDGWMLLPVVWGTGIGMSRWLATRARGRRGPRRWSRPRRRWRAGSVLARGRIAAEHEIVAPLSGRPAVAWLVHVRYADATPPTRVRGTDHSSWALVEQSVAHVSIDGSSVGDSLTLDLSPTRIDTMHPDAQRWLRTRGLDAHDDLELYESVIGHGDAVELRHDRRGGPPVLRRA
jgi:hypothetical protein